MKNYYLSFKKMQVNLWKSVLLLLAFMGCYQNANAQRTIPAGNAYTSLSYRPLSSNYAYDRTNSHYIAADVNISSGSTITGLRYYVESASGPSSIPIKIYMANASGIVTFSEIYGNALSGTTLVYSGTIPSTSFVSGKWVYIPLTTPFVYTGVGLQVLVEANFGPGSGSDFSASKQFRTSAGSSQIWQSFSTPISTNTYGVPVNNKPNIQIYYNTPGSPGDVSFDYDNVAASENTMASVVVNRNGGSTGTISVDYSTTNGTATAGTDYTTTTGTLTWADGDIAPKIISVPIASDFILDNGETIVVTLSNPVGTTITNVNPGTITITDVLPPMNGIYTVGTGGNYPSLTNAGGIFEAINNRIAGVSGPLTINIISDLPSELGTNALNEITGGYPVLIQPYGGSWTITGTNTFTNPGMIRFNGTDNVTINGSLTGATVSSCRIGGDASLRQLTIQNSAGTQSTSVAVLFQSGTNGAKNNTLKNLTISGGSSIGSGYAVAFSGNTGPSSLGVDNDGNRVENCAIKKALFGIYSAGESTANPNNGTVIIQNDFSATGNLDRIGTSAVYIKNETMPVVSYNSVYVFGNGDSNSIGLAIGSARAYSSDITSGGISGAMVSNNIIYGVSQTSPFGFGNSAAGISISGTASGPPNIVQNNMINNVSSEAIAPSFVAGINVVGAVASVTKLYNNTITLSGDRGTQTGQSPSFGISLTGLDPSLEMKNNIISNSQIVTGGGLVKSYAFGTLSTTFVNLDSDYNSFYSTGVQDGGFRSGSLATNAGTSYVTLADWQTAIADDSHSVEVAPVFVSASDLHLVAGSNPALEGSATPIASVTTDIDCSPRNATNPSMGADETGINGYAINAGAGTGGTISPAGTNLVAIGASPVYAITANCGYAISNVLIDGVSQGAISSYTFTNVSANHTITATFTAQTATVTAGGPTTFCIGGSVVLTSSSATGNIWSTGETTQSITALASGNYFVVVNNGSCLSQPSAPITVNIVPTAATPTVTASSSSLSFCQGGSVTLTSSATTGNLWSNGATTASIIVTTSGDYTVTYNNGSCISAPSTPITVTVHPLPPTPVITTSGPTTLCQGTSITLTSSAATGNQWSNSLTTQSINVSFAASFSVRVYDGTCYSANSETVTTTVIPLPTRPTISLSGATTFCQGGSVVLTSSAATGNLWSNGATTQSITVTTSGVYNVTTTVNGCTSLQSLTKIITVTPLPVTPTITASGSVALCTGGSVTLTSSATTGNTWSTGATTQSITVSTAGTYTVTATTGSCTSLASAGTVVTVNAAPSTPSISAGSGTTFCTGGSVTLTSSSATGNVWSTGATTQSITVSSAGSYTVSVSTPGCISGTSAATAVTVNPIPATPTISAGSATAFCQGGSVTLTSSAPTGNVWSTGATTPSITVATAGDYSVAVTTAGCTSGTSTATAVTVNPIPATPTISAGSATTFCQGGSVTLSSSAATGNVWSTGATTPSITVSTAGDYSVAVTTSGCTSGTSATSAVTVNSIPATPTISAGSATTFCQGGSVTLSSSSATGNVWSTGATTQSITVASAGDYSVAVTTSGCTSGTSATTAVTVNTIPVTPTISAGSTTTFCTGGTVTLTSSSTTGNVWSTGATTQSITVAAAGDYSVAVTTLGCTSGTSGITAVTVNSIPATPSITSGSTTTFCSGDSVTLTSSSASGNVWSTGATTPSITVSTAGDYSVAVTTSGCTSGTSAITSVSVNPAPNAAITQSQGVLTATQTNATYQWYSCPDTLVEGATSQTYAPTALGDYKVVVTLGTCTLASDCTALTELGTSDFDLNTIRLYPNPVTTILTIENKDELSEVLVYNMLGQRLMQQELNATTIQIDLSRLPSATYLIKVRSLNGTKTFKVVKE